MKKYVFLILHYYAIDETIKCVENIRKFVRNQDFEIVIVDNGSKNNTGLELEKKYKNEKDIHLILSSENLGFARGNNLGFKYAKDNLNPDFIIMINSDVYMIQYNFCDLISNEYANSKFSVLGPRIILPGNRICDYMDELPNLTFLKKRRIRTKMFRFFNKIYLRKIYGVYEILKIKYLTKLKKIKTVDTSIRKENVVLNGAALIFSKDYINLFDGIDDRTFLYYEEFLLYLRLQNNNLKSVYNPYIMVYHNENSSTNKSKSNKRKKFDFVLSNELESLNIVIKDMEGTEKNEK